MAGGAGGLGGGFGKQVGAAGGAGADGGVQGGDVRQHDGLRGRDESDRRRGAKSHSRIACVNQEAQESDKGSKKRIGGT
ncbi:hypothetical protein HpMS107_40390 [Helicobacter pylori]